MRSAIADFAVTQPLPIRLWGNDAFLCDAPVRLDRTGAVTVAELSLGSDAPPAAWRDVEGVLKRVAGIDSENLLQLIEAGPSTTGGDGYVACEPVTGSLATPVGHLEEGDQVAAVARAALGAHALHESGIAHGAIHPTTILLTEPGAVLTPPAPPGQGVVVTMSDWRDLATVAPDLLMGQAPSRASDIWSLGATLHLLLSPRPLFPAMSSEAPATAVQRIIFTRPEVDPALPPTVAEVVAACIAANPADRPSTAAEVARRLDRDGGR